MTQNQHMFLAILLMHITVSIYYFYFPRPEDEKWWEDKFIKWFGL
jgi:hypothetical protein